MSFTFFIARRYLFSRKSHHAINIISWISVLGVAVGTMALVCAMSVFNGFQDLVSTLYTSFDPELKVVPAKGHCFAADDSRVLQLRQLPGVQTVTAALEQQALVVKGGQQLVITLKGVEDNYLQHLDSARVFYGDGHHLQLQEAGDRQYGVPGYVLADKYLELQPAFSSDTTQLHLYVPRPGEKIARFDQDAFRHDSLLFAGQVFVVNQQKYDANYMLCSLPFVQQLCTMQGQVSQLDIKVAAGSSIDKVQQRASALLGSDFRVLNRREQQPEVFNIYNIEKLITFLLLAFILFVASFNIVGSLSMLMIDKKADVRTLRNLGCSEQQICRLFRLEGMMINVAGAVLGVLLGLALCWAQQTFGLIAMGEQEGDFIVNSYPVSVKWLDVVLVFLTVLLVGYLVTRIATRKKTIRKILNT